MINEKNLSLIVRENTNILKDAKHSLYYEINRTMSRLDPNNLPRSILVKPKYTFLALEVQRELLEQNVVSIIVDDPADDGIRLRIFLKD